VPKFSAATQIFSQREIQRRSGRLESIPANVDPDGFVTFARWDVSLMDRDPAAAERALAACRLEAITSQPGTPLPKSYLQGCIRSGCARHARAQIELLNAARPALEKPSPTARKTRHATQNSDCFTHSWEGKKTLFARAGRPRSSCCPWRGT